MRCFYDDTATTENYTLSLHDALPISYRKRINGFPSSADGGIDQSRSGYAGLRDDSMPDRSARSEEHTSELQSLRHLVCRLLLERKTKTRPATSQSRSK